jgi:eukaryotic-like serine/threonine-protein kinase
MPLTAGARLGPYEILAALGAGGMGEVYRALDTTLGRQVAIKILPDTFARDLERLARFDREAKTLAALNHPNIAQIYGFERADSVRALVMELVEGPTLAQRIAQGPIPPDEALPIARQIAEALEAAHDQGIIHRDLKPANITLRPDGTVKVLDFGLAKALEPMPAGGIDAQASPTITSPALMTGVGMLLGTAAYMSPEQARGKPVDRRADIWAFGCVLYEMLTGRKAFEGEDVSLTISQILQRDPAFDALPADIAARVRQAVRLCLRKPLKERIADIGSVRLLLDGAFEPDGVRAPTGGATAQTTWRRTVPFLLTGLLAAVLGGIGVWRLMPARPSAPHPVVRFALASSASVAPRGIGVGRHVLAISRDGTRLVYWADNKLYLRTLDRLDDATPIRGTEDGREPFFSPDGQWIGFHQQGQLKRVSVAGGAPVSLSAALNPWGVNWDADGVIRYGKGSDGIWQVSPNGGAPTRSIAVGQGELAHGPQLLPGGKWILFTLRPSTQDSWDQAQIVVQSLTSGERTVLIEHGRDARYVPTGHLIYGLNGVLLGVPFDVRTRRVTGPAVPLVDGVMDSDVRTGAMHFAVSNEGTLVYLAGASGARSTLNWVNRNGSRDPLPAEALAYSCPRVSPDGTRVAVEIAGPDGVDIQIYDLARKTLTRLTSAQASGVPSQGGYPLWTPDSQRVVFYSYQGGGGLYSMAADGTGLPKRLTTSRAVQTPYSWADSGRTLLLEQRSVDQIGAADIYTLSLAEGTTPTPLVQTAAAEQEPAVSPDGRWLAYTARESGGRPDVFVRPFPKVDDGRWRISTEGGTSALWSRDGRQLFFISGGRAMSVSLDTVPAFRPGTPAVLFELPPVYRSEARITRQWDIAPDSERFLVFNPGQVAATSEASHSRMVVVLNWYEELKRLVPTK